MFVCLLGCCFSLVVAAVVFVICFPVVVAVAVAVVMCCDVQKDTIKTLVAS